MMVAFNVNDDILVRLTPLGKALCKKEHDKYCAHLPYKPKHEDEKGFSRWQLHELMNVLGHHCSPGLALPFETEIYFEYDAEE